MHNAPDDSFDNVQSHMLSQMKNKKNSRYQKVGKSKQQTDISMISNISLPNPP